MFKIGSRQEKELRAGFERKIYKGTQREAGESSKE
jgi:hypothetical protein